MAVYIFTKKCSRRDFLKFSLLTAAFGCGKDSSHLKGKTLSPKDFPNSTILYTSPRSFTAFPLYKKYKDTFILSPISLTLFCSSSYFCDYVSCVTYAHSKLGPFLYSFEPFYRVELENYLSFSPVPFRVRFHVRAYKDSFSHPFEYRMSFVFKELILSPVFDLEFNSIVSEVAENGKNITFVNFGELFEKNAYSLFLCLRRHEVFPFKNIVKWLDDLILIRVKGKGFSSPLFVFRVDLSGGYLEGVYENAVIPVSSVKRCTSFYCR